MPDERSADPAAEVTRVMRRVEQAFLFGVPGTTEVWLIRHGDCYQDMAEIGDPPLSPLGREQAQRVGERVRQAGVAAVHSSDSRRAVQTAQAISSQVIADPRLREIENDPAAAVQLILNRHQSFSESAEAVARRMHEAIDEAAAANRGRRIAIVTHGVAILCYVGSLMGLEIPAGLRLMPYYTSVTVVRVNLDLDRRMVGSLVDATHLAGMDD
ncbi:MAG: histidine phosphatase family protein [Candidatus Dormibacteraeota bacterium]|nr:histidine phosphatase family protein [Candidatus Dormibacteraeota bacterium]